MEIDIKEIDDIKKYIVIDISNEIKTLKNSIKIPYISLILYPEKYLKKENKYLLICEYGIKSKKVSIILKNMGYNAFSLKGGISKYNIH